MHTLRKRIIIAAAFVALVGGVAYYCFPGLILGCAKHAIRWWSGLERHEVQVGDHRWVYLVGGKGEPILFVHGFGSDKDRFWTFLSAFSRSYRAVAPDLPGFGESTKLLSTQYDIANQAKRLNDFVESIGLDSFHMIGVSMGGYISGYYASEYPKKVRSLALMDAAGVQSRVPSYALRRFEGDGKNILLYRTVEGLDELMSVLFHHPPWIPRNFKRYFARRAARDYDLHSKILKDILDGGTDLLEGRLSRISAATLIIWGANDRIIDVSSVEKFASGIRNSRSVILDQCGHVPYIEKPEETTRIYKEFLARLP